MIIEDETNDVLSGGNGILVASDLSTHVDGGLESILHQLGFKYFNGLGINIPPRIIDDHDIPKGAFATEVSEHPAIPRENAMRENAMRLDVVNPVEVEDTGKRSAPSVSVYGRG